MSNESFIVDTGSSCSIWPYYLALDKVRQSSVTLHAEPFLSLRPMVKYRLPSILRKEFCWIFLVVELLYPILGADFLSNFNLLVDVRKQRLVDGYTSLSTPACVSTNVLFIMAFLIAAIGNQFHSLLASFPELVDPMFKSVKVMHSTCHHITMSRPLVFTHPRHLVLGIFKRIKFEFEHVLQLGLIHPSTSQ